MSLYKKLYPYQQNIIENNLHRKSYGLFLDMGLGKTLLSLAFAEAHNCTKIIIITINSKALEDENVNGSFLWWAKQSNIKYNFINKNNIINDDTLAKTKSKLKLLKHVDCKTNDILLINYESLFSRSKNRDCKVQLKENIKSFIQECRLCNTALIIDESHRIKDMSSLQTMAVMKIKQQLELVSNNVYTYLLTGTPFTAGYIDLYSQLKILGCQMNKTAFLDKFCIRGHYPSLAAYQQPIVDYKNIDQLFELVHNFAITIKSDMVVDLPEQLFVHHVLPQTKDIVLFIAEKLKADFINKEFKYRHIDKLVTAGELNGKVNNPFYRNIAYPDDKWIADTSSTFFMRTRQLSIGFQGNENEARWFNKTRLNEVKRLLEQNEDNYVLFYNFTPEFIELYEICEELNYKIDVFNGNIKSLYYYDEYSKLSEGQKLVNKKRIILANFVSGSTGNNWQLYNKCIIFSLPTFNTYDQALKRIHRLGQKNSCIYHIFRQDNYIDNKMWEALQKGLDYNSKLFENDLNEFQKTYE